MIASSAAPTAIPTPRAAPISTQTAAARNGPIRRCSAGAPRHVRDARDEANTVDPSSDRAMQTDSDAVGEARAITAAAIRGPTMKATSIATASSANAACRRSLSGTRSDQSVRMAVPVGMVPSPAKAPAAHSTATDAPPCASRISPVNPAAVSAVVVRITRVCPIRSITRPWTGREIAAAIE